MGSNLEREALRLRNKTLKMSLCETLRLIEDLERKGIIKKPSYNIIYSYPSPIYSFH
jgi:hypothetical protein